MVFAFAVVGKAMVAAGESKRIAIGKAGGKGDCAGGVCLDGSFSQLHHGVEVVFRVLCLVGAL